MDKMVKLVAKLIELTKLNVLLPEEAYGVSKLIYYFSDYEELEIDEEFITALSELSLNDLREFVNKMLEQVDFGFIDYEFDIALDNIISSKTYKDFGAKKDLYNCLDIIKEGIQHYTEEANPIGVFVLMDIYNLINHIESEKDLDVDTTFINRVLNEGCEWIINEVKSHEDMFKSVTELEKNIISGEVN